MMNTSHVVVRSALAATTLLATMLAGPAAITPARADPAKLIGTWIDHSGRGAVEFTACGTALCGRIVWMKDPNDAAGKPLTDGNNPDTAKRRSPICGLQVIGDTKPQADGSHDQGWIYDPEDGKSYSVEVRSVSPNILTVRGYAGIKLLGETFTWKRAPASLTRCAA